MRHSTLRRQFGHWRDRTGATLVEYTFIIAIISIAGVVLLQVIGVNTTSLLDGTNAAWTP